MGLWTVSASSDAWGGLRAHPSDVPLPVTCTRWRGHVFVRFLLPPVRPKKWRNCKLIRILDFVWCFLHSAGHVPSSHVIGWSRSSGDKWKKPFSTIACPPPPPSPAWGVTSCYIHTLHGADNSVTCQNCSADCDKNFAVRTDQLWHQWYFNLLPLDILSVPIIDTLNLSYISWTNSPIKELVLQHNNPQPF